MRIGPRMQQVQDFVARNPGCVMFSAAKYVAPHGTGIAFGYRTCWRCVRAGLVQARPGKRAGARYLYSVATS